MSRLPSQSLTAPSGMDVTSDPVAMGPNRARLLLNLQIDRQGLLRSNLRLVNQLSMPQGPIDGVAYYYQAVIRNNQTGFVLFTDLLVWVSQGFLLIATPSSDPLNVPVGNTSIVFGGSTGYVLGNVPFFQGKRVRFAALQDELLMVQDGGLLPLRFWSSAAHGTGFFRAGIEPPNITGTGPSPIPALDLTAVGAGLTGTWGYKLTFVDERFRESSPTPSVGITLVNQGTKAQYDLTYSTGLLPRYAGSNIAYAYLYRNTIGAPSVYYRIASATVPQFPINPVTFKAADFFYNPSAQDYDFAIDAAISVGVLAPNPGENDPPNAASVIAVFKNRVFLNDVTDSNALQVSNLLSTTQFTVIPTSPVVATDGVRSSIGTDQGDPITALIPFGSVLAIFKRRGCFFLYGDTLQNFVVRPIHERGCIAPDTAIRCDNVVCYLSDDGVYAAAYEAGEVVSKISKEIEEELFQTTQAQRESAFGWFIENSYHLAVASAIFVYSFDAQGWTSYAFGKGTFFLGDGVPDVSVMPGFGFNALPDAGLYGSFVPDEGPCTDECMVTVSPTSIGVGPPGGTFSIAILAQNTAHYGYMVSDAWMHIVGPGSGNGTATLIVDSNNACIDRSGTVTICDQVIGVTQTSAQNCCAVSVSPASFDNLSNLPSTQQINVTLLNALLPSASTDVSWLHVGNYITDTATTGHYLVTVDACPLCVDRSGHVMICDQTVLFHQPFSEVISPSTVITNGDAQTVTATVTGQNWEGDTFVLTPVQLGGSITHFPDDSNPTISVFIPKNSFNQTPDGKGGGLTQVWQVLSGCQRVLIITQYPSCVGPVDWSASNPQTTFSPDGSPIQFGPFAFTVYVPNSYDPNFPPYSTGVWTSPRYSGFPVPIGGTSATSWTITTPMGNSQVYTPTSSNYNMTAAQLAEFNTFLKSGGGTYWSVTVSVQNLQAYFPFVGHVTIAFEVNC